MILAVAVVLGAVMVKAVADMVADFTSQAQVIDRHTVGGAAPQG